jgi:hypothetical protein
MKYAKLLLAGAMLVVLALLITPSATAVLTQLGNDNGEAEKFYCGWRASDMIGAVVSPDPEWYYPIGVESVEFLLHQFQGAWGYAMVKAHVYSIVDGQPGQLLGSSDTEQVVTFYPEWASISLASANIALGGDPFMVVIEYMAGTSGATPAVMLDTTDDIPVGANFFYMPPIWYEHYELWSDADLAGYNMIRVTVDVSDIPLPPTPTPTPTPYRVYVPQVLNSWEEGDPTPEPTATYTPIPRPTMLPPPITPLFISPIG